MRRLPERATGEAVLLGWQTSILSDHLHAITRLASVNKVVVRQYIHRSWQLTSRCFLGHLL